MNESKELKELITRLDRVIRELEKVEGPIRKLIWTNTEISSTLLR